MTEPIVDELQAERDIGRQLVRFARGMDARDWRAIRAVLFDDATADFGTGTQTGSDAIIDSIRTYLDVCGVTQHLLGSIEIEVDGVKASSRAYVHDTHLGAGDHSNLSFATLGDYHDEWERDGGTWRLRHRLKYNHGYIGTMAVFGLPEVVVNEGS